MGDCSENGGGQGQFSLDSRRIVGLCHSNRGGIGPFSYLRSRFIHNPTASWGGQMNGYADSSFRQGMPGSRCHGWQVRKCN